MKQLFSVELESRFLDALDPILVSLLDADSEYREKFHRKNLLHDSLNSREGTPDFTTAEYLSKINEYFDLEMSTSTTEEIAVYLSGLVDAIVFLTKLGRLSPQD